MNERIRELYLQAVEYSNGQMTFGDTREFFAEKFAELMVKEVTNIVLHYTDVDEGVAVAKKHFGVEE